MSLASRILSKSSKKVNEGMELDFYITQVESKKKQLDQQLAIVINEAKKFVYNDKKESGNYSTVRASYIHKYLNELEAAVETLSDKIEKSMKG